MAVEKENADLKAQVEQNADLKAQNANLKAQNADLKAQVEQNADVEAQLKQKYDPLLKRPLESSTRPPLKQLGNLPDKVVS